MWMTLEEVAAYLKVSRETVYKLAQQRKLPASKVGNQWRFRKDLIDISLTGDAQTLPTNTIENRQILESSGGQS